MILYAVLMDESAGFKQIQDRIMFDHNRGAFCLFETPEAAVAYRDAEKLNGCEIVPVTLGIHHPAM